MADTELDPLVKRVLDGELRLEDLPPELRREGEAFVRLLAALDRSEIPLSENVVPQVMAEVREHAQRSPRRGGWRWWTAPHEVRLVIRPWVVGATLAAATIALVVGRPRPAGPAPLARARADSTFVRFELYSPGARTVGLAGSFNGWNAGTTPMVQVSGSGLWTVTLPLPAGTAQYGFIVDGQQWVPDPAAPSVDDGFGRRNSVVAVPGEGRAL